MRLRLISMLLVLLLVPVIAFAEGPTIKGSYTKVPGAQYRFDGKTVEVVEFLSFYCGHCYEFEKSIPVVKGNFPKRIKWKTVPIHWGDGSQKPAEAYFIAEDAGKGEQMKKALFHANFVEKKDIGRVEVLEALAADAGLGFDFSRRLRSGEKAGEAQKAIALAREMGVDETPSLIIAGNIMTNPHSAGHDVDSFRENTITIIRSILQSGK